MIPAAAPVLKTERLTLSGHTVADFLDSAAMWADPEVVRFIGGKPASSEEAWARVLRYIGHWTALGYGYWQVRETATGRFVGEIGLADFKREIADLFKGAPEAGWALAPWAHGRGYATEAVGAMLAWGAAERGFARTVCIIDPENTASIRVAEKLGFREITRAAYKGQPTVVFERS